MRLSCLIFNVTALALVTAGPLRAEDAVNSLVYVVTYFEAAAPAVAQAAALSRQFAETSRNEPGNAGFEALEEIGRPSRFATFEAWRDKAAFDAHRASAGATSFHDELQPTLVGPFETRLFGALSVGASSAQGGGGTVYVLTHVDVFPANKNQAVELVKSVAEAGRKDSGNLFFDVLQWDGHPNHFTLVEEWRDRKAFDATLMAAYTREFRRKLTPLEGALYDERLYQAVR